MPSLNPYLSFNGNCEAAFSLYRSIFGGELMLYRFKDAPAEGAGSFPVAEHEKERVMHCSITIGSTILMGSDTSVSCGQTVTSGDNITINISPDNESEAGRIFTALAEGGKIIMPLEKTFWAELFGMCIDKFGIPWMVNYGPCDANCEK